MRFFWKYKIDHVLFWIVTILFYAYTSLSILFKADAFQYWMNIFVRNGLIILICYINIYYLFPKFFKRNKFFLYSIFVLACMLFYTVVMNLHDAWLHTQILHDDVNQNLLPNSFYNFSIAVFYMGFTTALMLSKNWYQQHLLLQKIQVENLETELRYLKAQMNPHFLFNSINTIYFQIDKNNVEARTSLHKFSELLRYQLYECNEEQIAIEKEVEYLKSYIDLQRLRKQKNYCISFETDKNVNDFSIAPLLLIAFVENAFKHVSHYTDQTNNIKIDLHRENNYLFFDVVNSKNDRQSVTDGIGLKNVKRRLELLYADRHELRINNDSSSYTVHLKLNVS